MLRRYKRVLRQHASIFFLGGALFLLILTMGLLLFMRSQAVMEHQLKEGLRTAAALAADQFVGGELNLIRGPSDMNQPLFASMVERLNSIRADVPNAKYVYIMRKTANPRVLEFVADADSLQPEAAMDENGNGVIEPEEEASYPGDLYDPENNTAMLEDAFIAPATDREITVDQWGGLISGYAPIENVGGGVAGIIGIDMDADDYIALSHGVLSRLALLLILLLGIVTVGSVMFFVWTNKMEVLNKVDAERSATMRLAYHQLGAPIAMFRWWLEILQDQVKCERGGPCDQLGEAVDRMEKILRQMREATDAEKGFKKYEARSSSLKDILETVIKDLEPRFKRRNQKVEVHIEDLPRMQMDPKMITGVFHELLDNAIDYSPDGEVIVVGIERDRKKALISIADKGCGVPAKDIDRIFNKWVRASNANKFKPIGNGLGLFIAREIVERAGGEMWVESIEGKGSTFWFTLPLE